MNTAKGGAVNLRKTETVIGISNSKKQMLVVGREYNVHPLTASNLVASRFAKYKDASKQAEFEKENKVSAKAGATTTDDNENI